MTTLHIRSAAPSESTRPMTTITNPILPGFHPDPSICRVGEWYCIATSTFHWFPGVRIHRSRDLANWELCPSPLTRVSQLNMRGIADSGGIWAPCLTHTPAKNGQPGKFWLIYTVVHSRGFAMSDFPNYLVTAESIDGPWSEPIYLNSSGFDPSMFHDEDGRHWMLNMVWDHRQGNHAFDGILLQEYDEQKQRLIGERKNIFKGTEIKVTEGPHLYKHDGKYYLMVAEGGTYWEHAVTIARSDKIDGPYEVDPQYPMMTAVHDPSLPIQKSGHASLVETPEGEPILAHLGGRPVGEHRRCILGRETSLQRCEWTDDGWLRLKDGGREPQLHVELPWETEVRPAKRSFRCEFDGPEIPPQFQSLRVPIDDSWLSLTERPGWCRLHGRESLFSRQVQSLIATRVCDFKTHASTRLEFSPKNYQQMAGLLAYYDTRDWYYIHITANDEGKRVLRLSLALDGVYDDGFAEDIVLPDEGPVDLRAEIDHAVLRMYYQLPGQDKPTQFGPDLDATVLSDDYGEGVDHFTGAFYGIACQDLSGTRLPADFEWFEYGEG